MKKEFIDKLALIEVKNRRALFVRSKGLDTWYLPGGTREEGEDDAQTLTREIKEELSVDIIQTTIKHFGTFQAPAHGKSEGTMVRIVCYTAEFEGELKAETEIEEFAWLSSDDKDKTTAAGRLLLQNLKNKNLID